MLPKILPVAYISSFTVMTYLKKLIGTKSLNTVQQDCFLELYPLPMKKKERKRKKREIIMID